MPSYGRYPGPRMGDLMPGQRPRTPTTDDVAWGIVDPNDPRFAGSASPTPGAVPPNDPRVPAPPPDQNRPYTPPAAPASAAPSSPTPPPTQPPAAPTAPTTAPSGPAVPLAASPYQAAMDRIQAAYKKYLGREGTPAELASHLGNGRAISAVNVDFAINNISTSKEARDYLARQNSDPTTDTDSQPGGSHAYTGGALDYYGTGDIEGAEGITRGSAGEMSGFSENGLNGDKNVRGSNTIKNVSGRIFSHYPAKPSSIPLVLADPRFKAKFPNAKQVGFDKIDYGDGKPVDVLEAADPNSDTAKAWAWMPESTSVPDTAGTGYTAWRSSQQSSDSADAGAGTDDGFSRRPLVDPRSYPNAGQWTGPRAVGLDDQWLV